jgi:hypothetical protein
MQNATANAATAGIAPGCAFLNCGYSKEPIFYALAVASAFSRAFSRLL